MSTTNSIAILGGRLIDPANGIDKISNLYINNGKIIAVGDQPVDKLSVLVWLI